MPVTLPRGPLVAWACTALNRAGRASRGLTAPRCSSLLVTQSCLNLCNPVDCSPPGSSVHGILQARILDWVASKESAWMWETQVWSLDQEESLEKETTTHSSVLAWRISWTEKPGRLQFMVLHRVGHDWATNTFHSHKCSSQQWGLLAYVLSYFSRVWLCVTLWIIAYWVPLSMEFSRQEYWSGLPCPLLGNFLYPGTELTSLASSALQADSLPLSHQGSLNDEV